MHAPKRQKRAEPSGTVDLLSAARHRVVESDAFELREVGGGADIVSKSLGTVPSIFSITPKSKASKEVTRPFVESWVYYRCLRLLSDKGGAVRLRIYESDDPKAKEVGPDHPLRKLFDNPGQRRSFAKFIAAGIINEKSTGENFWFLCDKDGKPCNPMLPGHTGTETLIPRPIPLPVQIVLSPGGKLVTDFRDEKGLIQAWQYATTNGSAPIFPHDSVVQFASYNAYDAQRGMSELDVCLPHIGTAHQTERLQDSVMRGGGYGAYLNRETAIDPKENQRQQDEFNEKARDPDNRARTRFLNGGKWNAFANPATAKNLGVFEQLKRTDQVISGILGVPMLLLGGMEGATFANLAEAWRELYRTVVDILTGISTTANSQFISRLADKSLARCRIAFAIDEIEALKTDNTERYKAAAEICRGTGVSFEEACANIGLEFIPSKYGSRVLVPSSTITIEDILPDPNADAAAQAMADVQAQALNGAQVSGMLEILTALSDGMLTPEGAIAALVLAFPTMDEPEARRLVSGVNEKPPEPAPTVDPNAPPSPKKPAKALDEIERSLFARIPHLNEAERAYFAKDYERRILINGDRKVYRQVKRWYVEIEKAYLARLKRIAGTASKSLDVKQKISLAEFDQILLESEAKWEKLLEQYAGPAIDDVFELGLADASTETGGVSIAMTDPRVLRALRNQKDFLSKGVTATTNDRVRAALLKVLGEPSNIGDLQLAVREQLPELTDELKRVFGTKESRALTIARTESGKASSTARFMQYGDDGVKQLQWITSHDDHVRETHRELDGKVASYGSEFASGLRYPRDEDGPAGEVINCRCTFAPVTPDDDQ